MLFFFNVSIIVKKGNRCSRQTSLPTKSEMNVFRRTKLKLCQMCVVLFMTNGRGTSSTCFCRTFSTEQEMFAVAKQVLLANNNNNTNTRYSTGSLFMSRISLVHKFYFIFVQGDNTRLYEFIYM